MEPLGGSVVSATRRFSFSAAHRYARPGWTAAENETHYGSLARIHGHTYALEITVRGPVDTTTGMLMDLAQLKRVVGETILARFDHAFLNDDPAFAAGVVPTTENLVQLFWDLLIDRLGPGRLHRVRLWEDPSFHVEYFGEP